MAATSWRLAVRLALRLAQGKVGREAAALASLALLGLLLLAMVGCWGYCVGGDVGASVVAHWWGDGVLTVLVLARWCQKRRDPTINKRWKG